MKLLRVGFTNGDINGIGLEMLIKTLACPEMLELCTPVIFSDQNVLRQTIQTIDLENPLDFDTVRSANDIINGRVNLVNVCNEPVNVEWGAQTEQSLKAEANSLNAAIEAYKNNLIDLLVCCPGQLDNDFDSHSLSDFIRQALGEPKNEFDWIVNGDLRMLLLHSIAFTTELGEGMAIEAFMNDITAINHQLREDFGYIRPRIAVLSQNQKLGADITELREHGLVIFGPFDAKSFIEAGNHRHYDAVLFLEEEEARHALIDSLDATKTIGYVAGLPLVLSYPLVPVSHEEAGRGTADETPLREALYAAIDIWRNRENTRHATHHPLEKQWIPKGRDDFKLDLTKDE
ncbi:MAG: 4-hydroxythreonine-4-phosphate dehydrogenase PdxA [Bacteroidales bacterium]|nr:4-hydroxythreonine-4-phosphate dehydrogenase PdxA [Candidatus Liminaster caballi]